MYSLQGNAGDLGGNCVLVMVMRLRAAPGSGLIEHCGRRCGGEGAVDCSTTTVRGGTALRLRGLGEGSGGGHALRV